jgi:hypothetical protein
MSRRKSSAKPNYSRADVEAALRNLIRKGLVVAREDINGKVVYFTTESAPPLEPFELESLSAQANQLRAFLELPFAGRFVGR